MSQHHQMMVPVFRNDSWQFQLSLSAVSVGLCVMGLTGIKEPIQSEQCLQNWLIDEDNLTFINWFPDLQREGIQLYEHFKGFSPWNQRPDLDSLCVWTVKALAVIKSALKDSWVRTGRRYSLLQRAKKICQSASVRKSPQKHNLWQDFAADYMNDVSEPHSVIIVITSFLSELVFIFVCF